MSVSEMAAVLLVSVLSFFIGAVWGVFLSGRGWRKAKVLIHAMQDCIAAMADETLRLRGLVKSLGGDPGPAPPAVVRLLGGKEER